MTGQSSPPSDRELRLDIAELSAFLDGAFPVAARPNFGDLVIVEAGRVQMRLTPTADMIRPGGIVSGPALMGLVDVAAYAIILAHIGPVAMAVTSALNINFLRGCKVEPIVADARLLKLGRRQATADVRLWQEAESQLIAQATVAYALP
jgi:uncharacterized protein (TIGR00369 family)